MKPLSPWLLSLITFVSTGCYTGVEFGDAADSSGDDGDAQVPAEGCGEMATAAAPMRRLTDVQYRNTIEDLFGGVVTPSDAFPETLHNIGYTNRPDANVVSLMNAEEILVAAEEAAVQVVDNLGAILPCDQGSDSCAEQYIVELGTRAYRRPLAEEERQLLVDLYHRSRGDMSFADAIGTVVMTVLSSPQFLYLVEEGEPQEGLGDFTVALTDYEVASRLSYLLWDTMPDPTLFEAAAAGELSTPDEIEAQARRMLADRERAAPAVTRFYREWMHLEGLESFDKDPALFPGYDDALVSAMDEEFDRFVESIVWSDDPTVARLFSSSTTQADGIMAAFLGVDGPTTPGEWETVELDASRRSGILTRPALLAEHANRAASSPIFRGNLVRTQVLCEPIPPPPPDAMANAPAFPPDSTQRERSDTLMGENQCKGCHQLMNPIGLGFENYDPVGAWRSEDVDGSSIDASGEVIASRDEDLNGAFDGAAQLVARLAQSEQVRQCVADQFYQHSFGVTTIDMPSCAIDPLREAFEDTGGDLMELMVALTRTEAFRYRQLRTEES